MAVAESVTSITNIAANVGIKAFLLELVDNRQKHLKGKGKHMENSPKITLTIFFS